MGGSGTGTRAAAAEAAPAIAAVTVEMLIEWALAEIGKLGIGETPITEDCELGLRYLNDLIDSNNIVESVIYTVRQDILQLVANQQSYTIGIDPDGVLTADFAITRPTRIKTANLYLTSSPVVKRELNILDDERWAKKQYLNVFAYPIDLYCDDDYPLANMYFYPGPGGNYQVEMWSWQQGGQFNALTDSVAWPPGYRRWLILTLAEALCGPFGTSLTSDQRLQLMRHDQRIKSHNSNPPAAETDPALSRRVGGGSWRDGWMR